MLADALTGRQAGTRWSLGTYPLLAHAMVRLTGQCEPLLCALQTLPLTPRRQWLLPGRLDEGLIDENVGINQGLTDGQGLRLGDRRL